MAVHNNIVSGQTLVNRAGYIENQSKRIMDINNSEKCVPATKTVILCGTSRLPENVTAKHVFGFFTLEIEVEPADFQIVNAACTMCPSLGEKMLLKSLIGYEVEEGIKNAVESVNTRFFSTNKKAVAAALRDLHIGYVEYRKNMKTFVESPICSKY